MERRTTLAIMMILALSMAAQAEDGTPQAAEQKAGPKWSEQSKSVQRLFEQQSPNWVKIGDKLWCVEVMREAEKRSRDEAYRDVSAPWFYEPVGTTRCRTIGEVYKVMKLDAPEGYEVLEGRVNYLTQDGFFIYLHKTRTLVFIHSKSQPDLKLQVTVLGIKQSDKYHSGGKGYAAYQQLQDYGKVVTPEQVFDYFIMNQIKEFPVWRAKPNREHDGFEWNNYPQKFNLPN